MGKGLICILNARFLNLLLSTKSGYALELPCVYRPKYENLLIICDFNINKKRKRLEYDKLDESFDLFHRTNLRKSETCFAKNLKSLVDLLLLNIPLSIQEAHVKETGLSDYHKLITTFLKIYFSGLRPKVLSYRNYKNFYESRF